MKRELLLFVISLFTVQFAFSQIINDGSFEKNPTSSWELKITEAIAPGSVPKGYDVVADNQVYQDGKISVRVSKDSLAGVAASFGCFRQVIPGNFQGKKIHFSGFIKTSEVNNNSAATLWYGVHNAQTFDVRDMNAAYVTGTKDWASYSMEITITQVTDYIVVGGLLMGDGKAWFDNLSISSSPLVEDADINSAVLFVKQNSYPLPSTGINISKNSLARIFQPTNRAKIIGLGEVTHGTSEAYTLRTSISKFLIENRGFTTICLENSYAWTEALNDYIQTGKGTLDSLMRHNLLGMWQNEEMKSLFTWMREYNKLHTQKISLKGMDYSQLEPDIILVKKNTATLKDDSLNQWTDKLQGYFRFIDSVYHGMNIPGFQADDKKLVDYFVDGYGITSKIQSQLSMYKKKMIKNRFIQTRTALQNALLACYNFYRVQKENVKEPGRDSIMYEMVKRFTKEKPGTRIIIWAHNAHIAKKPIYNDMNGGGMGSYLNKNFLGQYYTIGTGTAKGTYAATNEKFVTEQSKFSPVQLDEPTPGSWEALLNNNSTGNLFIDLKKSGTPMPSLYHRVIGQSPVKGNEPYVKVKLNELYDGFIFMPVTNAAKSF